MFNYLYNVKKHFVFDKDEMRDMLLIILVFTVVLGYNDGHETFVMGRWLLNLLTSFVIASSMVIAKEAGHKLVAIKVGYTTKMKVWWPILFVNLFIAVLTDGMFHIVLPVAGLLVIHHEKLRIGKFRYGQNYVDNAMIGFAGPLFNIAVAMLFKVFSFFPDNPTIILAMQMNLIYAMVNLIPIDILFYLVMPKKRLEHADITKHPAPLAGTYMFYSTRLFYTFCTTIAFVLSGVIFVSGIITSVITALVVAGALFVVLWYERDFAIV